MEIKELISPQSGDKTIRFFATCGLEVHITPRPFSSFYMALGVKFGSLHTKTEQENLVLPFGCAHFMEHKMFDMPGDVDAFQFFAEYGANANAFTTNEYTAYVCSTLYHSEDVLKTLLQFVFTPCFTDKNIKKEIDIIEQEMISYQNDPAFRAYSELLSRMYLSHPIREDITGNRQSIHSIKVSHLKSAYQHFYRPDNMVLCIAGNISPDRVNEIIDMTCGTEAPQSAFKKQLPVYDVTEGAHDAVVYMDASRPRVSMGYKNRYLSVVDSTKQGYYLDIAAQCLFGKTSQLYRSLMDNNQISREFDGYYEWTIGAGHIIIGFDSDYPDEVVEIIRDYLDDVKNHMPTPDQFEEIRAVQYANAITTFDSLTDTALTDLEESMCDGDWFAIPSLIEKLNYQEFCREVKLIFLNNEPFVTTVLPKKNKEKSL